jgi:hypothetical protein
MRFDQARDILQHQLVHYHRSVSRLYQEFAGGELSPRNRLMVDFLVEHELRLAQDILDFMGTASHGALDYWFKSIDIPFPVPSGDVLTDACRTDLDQLVGAAVSYKTALIDFFAHLLRSCDAEETARLFQSLKSQEEKGMKRFIRQAQGLADL